ncbi:hypothetical protein [Roseomonas sp. 18066]|uniref:hypothetical protein n=1 Tax=Roseomonas sp. 18066 TaxID=2681412 RepID=UPI00135A0225|nr:hypothetical protein [Roseomonas sp. 18066]
MVMPAGRLGRLALLAPALLVAALLPAAPLRAEARLLAFVPADRAARQAWDGLLRQDAALARDARRQRFVPARDLAMLRADLNGDGRPELFLYANLLAYCGSAGCMVRILSPRAGGWALVCETYAEDGVPMVAGAPGATGWRGLRGTYDVTWRADPRRPLGIACVEGETIPRAEQGRLPAPAVRR